MSQNSYLRKFYSQVSKIVFVADLTVLSLIRTVSSKLSQNSYIWATFLHKYQKSCSLLISPFYGLLQLYKQKCHKTHISASSVYKYYKSCS